MRTTTTCLCKWHTYLRPNCLSLKILAKAIVNRQSMCGMMHDFPLFCCGQAVVAYNMNCELGIDVSVICLCDPLRNSKLRGLSGTPPQGGHSDKR